MLPHTVAACLFEHAECLAAVASLRSTCSSAALSSPDSDEQGGKPSSNDSSPNHAARAVCQAVYERALSVWQSSGALLVLLFSNFNKIVFGYFDPENIFIDNEHTYLLG